MGEVSVGLELGIHFIRCFFFDSEWNILAQREDAGPGAASPDIVIDRVARQIREIAGAAGIDMASVGSIGVGVPGPVNQKAGILFSPPALPGWDRVPLGPRLNVLTGRPVFLENDANAAGWGEYQFGAGRGCRNMVMITIEAGIGGAVIINGDLLLGRDGMAAEIGHIPIKKNGNLCLCGSRGCAEAYASPRAMVARFRKLASKGWRSALVGRGDVSCADIFQAAADGDALCHQLVEYTGRCLGVLAATIVNFVNPERIVVGGYMFGMGAATLLEAMRKECLSRCFGPSRSADMLPAALGGGAVATGVANLARSRLDGSGAS